MDWGDYSFLRTISFFGKTKEVFMQVSNGPCPLIAIANLLILRDEPLFEDLLKDSIIKNKIKLADLLNIVSVILTNKANQSSQVQKNGQANSSAQICNNLIDLSDEPQNSIPEPTSLVVEESRHCDLLNLETKFKESLNGLNLNLIYDNVLSFKKTTETLIFEILNIPLVHLCLPDPVDVDTHSLFYQNDYDHMQDQLVNLSSQPAESLEFLKATLISEFMQESKHCFTEYGLKQLKLQLTDQDRLAILFMSSHFSLLIRHNNNFYTLVTDVGYIESDHVWKELDNPALTNSLYFNSDFELCDIFDGPSALLHTEVGQNSANLDAHSLSYTQEADLTDEKLAKHLQEQEDKAYALTLAQAQNSTQISPHPVPNNKGYSCTIL